VRPLAGPRPAVDRLRTRRGLTQRLDGLLPRRATDTEVRFADAPYDARTADLDRVQLAVLAARRQTRRG
jgi:hypothetical protein